VGEAIVEIIENQLRDNNPPETAATLQRLLRNGTSRVHAMQMIATVMSVELFNIMKSQAPYDEQRYVNNLRRLPELPFGESDEI